VTTQSRHTHPVAPNLLATDFTAETRNQKWVGDISYIDTLDVYLSFLKHIPDKEMHLICFATQGQTIALVSGRRSFSAIHELSLKPKLHIHIDF